jgi:hypothetical protein
MKNIFGIVGILIFLKSIEGMIAFYSLAFFDAGKIDIWTATEGVVGTAVGVYLLFSIIKWIVKIVTFWYNPDPKAEIEL